jgi:4-amino-4-deoxy-L-arabinose transferase-like glycosyltransferase
VTTSHASLLHRLLLGLLIALFVGLGAIYVWTIPLFDGPDEYAHFAYIGYLAQEKQLPRLDEASARISHQLIQQPPFFYAMTTLAVGWLPIREALAGAVPNPYLEKGLSYRAYLTLPDAAPESRWAPYGARLVSLLGATLAVLGTWMLVRRLLPQAAWAAYVAAALVGFNPQFLFSAATITNDTWAAALPVWALWLALAADTSPRPWRIWAGVGALVGAAALTKYSALAVMMPLVIVALLQCRSCGWRYLAQSAVSGSLGFGVVAGWWFAYTGLVYGEAIPFAQMVALQSRMAWSPPLDWRDETLWRGVRWLLRSYWGVFGYGIIAPAAYHGVVQNMLLVAIMGYGAWAVRSLFDRTSGFGVALLLASSWFVMAFASLLNWMRLMRYTDQGRLLFPVAPALAILIMLGWLAWMSRRMQPWGAVVAIGLMIRLGFSQVETLHAAYAMPPILTEPQVSDRPIEARFEGGMTLLGIDLPAGATLEAGKTLPLTLYWTTNSIIPENYTLFIHLADGANRLLYQFDGVPYGGRHPTRQWLPGQRFADHYMLVVQEAESDGLATLSLGFYPYDDPNQRQSAMAMTTGAVLGNRLTLASVRLLTHADPLPFTATPAARWQNGIELASYETTMNAQSLPQSVTLHWQASQIIHQDYTVFVQVLDRTNQVIAQVDRSPQQGQSPTSTWRKGDGIEDVINLPPPTGKWQQVIVGLYDQSGQVLEVVEPSVQGYFTLERAD